MVWRYLISILLKPLVKFINLNYKIMAHLIIIHMLNIENFLVI